MPNSHLSHTPGTRSRIGVPLRIPVAIMATIMAPIPPSVHTTVSIPTPAPPAQQTHPVQAHAYACMRALYVTW